MVETRAVYLTQKEIRMLNGLLHHHLVGVASGCDKKYIKAEIEMIMKLIDKVELQLEVVKL